ncbi:isochorismatase hydrolase [Actinobacteria bacterium OK074]|nr:isochorismatase hydrolase [Actinobacteria bacterium OK074]
MAQSALLVMDVQRSVVHRFGAAATEYLPRVRQAVDAARTAGVPVIYVVVSFRPGAQEISESNKMFGHLAQLARGGGLGSPEAFEVHPDVAPEPDEVVVTKKRVSGFAGSDLEMVLRAQGIDTLVLTGIATSGVVLSTLRQASDLDYRLTVLADACLDGDPEVHRVLTEKVFPMQADVVTVAEWAKALSD